jgi:muconolactone delta-isomerase
VDHNKKQKASEKENDWYRDLAADGLLQDNWGDKVEYLHYSIHEYGEREAPDDDSLFRFQSAEWQHFDATPQEGGSSSNRLDYELHKEYGEDKR